MNWFKCKHQTAISTCVDDNRSVMLRCCWRVLPTPALRELRCTASPLRAQKKTVHVNTQPCRAMHSSRNAGRPPCAPHIECSTVFGSTRHAASHRDCTRNAVVRSFAAASGPSPSDSSGKYCSLCRLHQQRMSHLPNLRYGMRSR